MNLLNKVGDILKKYNSSNQKNQELVPVEVDVSENRDDQSKTKSLPSSSKLSSPVIETSGSLMKSRTFSKLAQDEFGKASISGTPFYTLGGKRIKITDNIYDLTRKIHKALASTMYGGKSMVDKSDNLAFFNILNDLGYTGDGDKNSEAKRCFLCVLPKKCAEIKSKEQNEEVFYDFEGQGIEKFFISSNTVDIYNRLEVLLGLRSCGQNNTFTEASKLMGELHKRSGIEIEQQNRNALSKFHTK